MIALNINLEILTNPPLIFTEVSIGAKFGLWGHLVSKRSKISDVWNKSVDEIQGGICPKFLMFKSL